MSSLNGKVALITGAAHRIGATITRMLHAEGMNIIVHYRSSRESAQALQEELNAKRENSIVLIQADLHETAKITEMVREAIKAWGRLDVVVNNASSFYPAPVGKIDERVWDDLIGSNLKAPLFLSQAAAPHLKANHGCIVNIVDIHAERPLKNHTVYSVAKAGLVMLTKSLARELGPEVRVNAVAPGAILWPESDIDDFTKKRIISGTALKRQGEPKDIARAVRFLIKHADYMSGQVLTVDGGRTLTN
ncbi:pteridine reductase [Sulfuriflexus mobilis]|uniref:pteridine reductase n=1 Tax=Sulfuriflexus mobilis TaxID=1811807 RepID=UPI001558B717|nr:pteridine reductase [Sulfuriflexus mobilis]